MKPALLWLALGAALAPAAPMTSLERQRLVAHLEMTSGWLADEVSGLSRAQLRFHPAPQAWSILEVVEHLMIAGPIYWQDLQKALQSPPARPARPEKDAEVLWYRGIHSASSGTRGSSGRVASSSGVGSGGS